MTKGFTLWFTGLSGAGKTTIAELVRPELERRGRLVEWLDGDEVREHLSKGLGFSKADRDTNIDRIGWVASRLTRHGAAVIVSAISPCGGRARMSVATEAKLIAPHGGELVDRTGERPADLGSLDTLTLSSRELSDLDMLACGALSPLAGFMGRDDYESVLETMRLAAGLPWALPVCLSVGQAPRGDRVAPVDGGGKPYAVL